MTRQIPRKKQGGDEDKGYKVTLIGELWVVSFHRLFSHKYAVLSLDD